MNQSPLRIVFAGTPDFAAVHLKALLNWPHYEVVGIYTQPTRGKKHGQVLPSPVKLLADENNVPVFQPKSLKAPEEQVNLATLRPDVMVVVAYGVILPKSILDIPHLGCINVHGSILPRWRGAAPIERAIEAGDSETGITIMQMDEGLDTGDILTIERCNIAADETGGSLRNKLAQLGVIALKETLAKLVSHQLNPQQQDNDLSCKAAKITKEETKINWQENAFELARKIRAFNPLYTMYSFLNGERIKIYRALPETNLNAKLGEIISADKSGIVVGCGENSCLRILELQLPGGKMLSAGEVLNGRADLFTPGHVFDRPIAYQNNA